MSCTQMSDNEIQLHDLIKKTKKLFPFFFDFLAISPAIQKQC